MDKDEILKIIAKLFKEKGFYNTSIKDISENVGLKGGSLYYYIKSKEDVLFDICEQGMNESMSQWEKIAYGDYEPKEKLRKMIENQIDYFCKNFYVTCVFLIEIKALGDNFQKTYIQKRDRFESHLRDVLKEGMEKGVFRKGHLKLMTFAILGMLNWMVIWYNPEGKWGSDKIKAEFIKTVFSGIEKKNKSQY